MHLDGDRPYSRGGWLAWLVCLSAGLFFFYEFFQLNIFDVINQPLREDFHLNATQLGWMSSTYLWADILFLLPAGVFLDRFSTRRVILIALIVCVSGTFGFALTTSFFWACLFHFLSGIGNAFCFLSCVVLVSRWFPPRRQALVIGLVVTMAFLGGMMAHTPFAYLTEQYGWRNSLLLDGAVGVVLLVWIFFVIQDRPHNAQVALTPLSFKELMQSLLKVMVNWQNWYAGLYTSFLNLPIMVLCALWGASYLRVVHHLTPIAASNVVSLIYIGSIIGCPLMGWLSDLQGRRKPLMVFGAVATLLIVLPLFLDRSLSQLQLSILFFILGFVTSTQVITYPLIAESNAERNTGSATGVASVIIMGGAGVAQVLFGWLIQHHARIHSLEQGPLIATHNAYSTSDFQYAMWMFPVAALFALVAIGLTRETGCIRQNQN
jgi:MFS family permease